MTHTPSYLKTHGWINFTIPTNKFPAKLWILLGECQSKCSHIAGTPLQPSVAQNLHLLYLAKGILATTAIEGNTLSEEEVLQHLHGDLKLPASRDYLKQEIDNILPECNRMTDVVNSGKTLSIDVATIKSINKAILKNLSLQEGVLPGVIRNHTVRVGRYTGAPHEECEYLLHKLCDWLALEFEAQTGMEIVFAIIKAVVAHLYLAWIHPFGDGNGRTARLVEFQILNNSGIPAPACHLLSNHYNLTRAEYYRQLDYASASGGDILPFLTYSVQGLSDGLRSQIEHIRKQQMDIVWRNYVHEQFRDKNQKSDIRKKHLVLDLPDPLIIIPISQISQISARTAVAYSKTTTRTVYRDIADLANMKLIMIIDGGIIANKEIISAFLPVKADPSNNK